MNAGEVLAEVARATWHDAHNGAVCPPERIPSEADLCAWLPECTTDAHDEASRRLIALAVTARRAFMFAKSQDPPPDRMPWWWTDLWRTAEIEWLSDLPIGLRTMFRMPSVRGPIAFAFAAGAFAFARIEEVHAAWFELGSQSDRPLHPLAPLVAAWQDRPLPVEPERRETGIMPAPFVARINRSEQAEFPGFEIDVPGPVLAVGEQAYLPGMEPEGEAMPAMLLALYDEAGGLGRTPGPGATAAMHLFVESLLSVPVNARTGELYRVVGDGGRNPLTVREVAGLWLQWNLRHYRTTGKRTGELLRNAWRHVRDISIPINRRGGFYFPVLFEAATGWRLNDRIALLARIPSEGRVGPTVDRAMLRYLRTVSEPAYRAYLSLCFEWDRYGATTDLKAEVGRKHRLILPTRPVARRNEQGYILDAKGEIVTGRGGVAVKSPYHPRAILTDEREPNPARERYPLHGADDLVRLCYPLRVFEDADARRAMRSKGRKAIETIETAGGCTIERHGNRPHDGYLPWRIMPARKCDKAFRNA